MPPCPLCHSQQTKKTYETSKFSKRQGQWQARAFYGCAQCNYVFVPLEYQLSATDEKSRYATHDNDLSQQGYRDFLLQMWRPLLDLFEPDSATLQGLDFGCGPTTAFAELAGEMGIEVYSFDPYFSPSPWPEDLKFDFVWCSEVIEHCASPLRELKTMLGSLKPGGHLALMTELWGNEPFESWYYIKDPTHIGFFHESTMDWLAKKFSLQSQYQSHRVRIFQKSQ